jgi:nitrate/TMAO reductase-like tetraheme cytochrome c subunit
MVLIAFGFLMFIAIGAGWEYTNSSAFCGTTCHTMPPEYVAYQQSPHARVNCVECHIGRGLIATQFTRKASDLSHVIKFVGADYEAPIYIKHLRPASQICERCHNPSKFSDDSLREFKHYDAAQNNAPSVTNMAFKTGGGTHREGRGKGIHWHIENQVDYIATDDPHLEQVIPWVRVTYAENGEPDVFVDATANLPADFVEQNQARIKTVDCMTCHNRISHQFPTPSNALDDAMARGIISAEIPYFKQNAVAVMERQYPSMEEAKKAIDGLQTYYQDNWPTYFVEHEDKIAEAVRQVNKLYQRMVFPTMDVSWDTHPSNVGHEESAGCFRCHDGKHLNDQDESIRIECNLCHSIPIGERPDGSVPSLPVEEAFEPESHSDSIWLAKHRFAFDDTCAGCHDTVDAGGVSDASFCANSACHGVDWQYAGLNAPGIVELSNTLDETLPTYPEAALTWDALVGPILQSRCVACHGGTAGLYLDSYEGLMAGGNLGPAVIPGDVEGSLLVELQRNGHPNSLPSRELTWIEMWITTGAPQ